MITFLAISLHWNLITLMIACVSFLVAMGIYRAPVVALMPDIIPSEHRSKANGVINLMGGVGAVYAFLVGSFLYSIKPYLAFGSTSILMVLAMIILVITIREPIMDRIIEEKKPEEIGVLSGFKEVYHCPDKSGVFILLAIFFWFCGYNAKETFFTKWAVNNLLRSKK